MTCIGKTIIFANAEWVILDWNNQGCLLLAIAPVDICVWDSEEFHPKEWESSEICEWLNGEFFTRAFSPEEQSAIFTGDDSTYFGRNNQSGVFLLSIDEARKYADTISSSLLFDFCAAGKDLDWWLRDDEPTDDRCAVLIHDNRITAQTDAWPFEYDDKWIPHAVRPVIWLDFAIMETVMPGWVHLGELFAYEVSEGLLTAALRALLNLRCQ